MNLIIRPAIRDDCASLLGLMRGLAKFEGYIDDFCVTQSALETRGFPETGAPEFYAIVAEQENQVIGMLAYYFIPFTYDLRPTLFIKELFIDPTARNNGAGDALFQAVREAAKRQHCGRIKWDVLHNNTAAKRFYERQGARQDSIWRGYFLETF